MLFLCAWQCPDKGTLFFKLRSCPRKEKEIQVCFRQVITDTYQSQEQRRVLFFSLRHRWELKLGCKYEHESFYGRGIKVVWAS